MVILMAPSRKSLRNRGRRQSIEPSVWRCGSSDLHFWYSSTAAMRQSSLCSLAPPASRILGLVTSNVLRLALNGLGKTLESEIDLIRIKVLVPKRLARPEKVVAAGALPISPAVLFISLALVSLALVSVDGGLIRSLQ